ncbi:MAG: ribonuclease HIII [Verrucomicrobia bacterium]|nr:ribonuclease HIII [Verrucomicrobiota bacterium]MBS0646096.1 ribonuclease HIII [Verrucomicrobiota bacterium]
MSSPFVVQIDPLLESKLRAVLEKNNFTLTCPPHTLLQAKKDRLCCTLYTSGKLVVQGKGMEEFITFVLEPEVLGTFTYGQHHHIDPTARIGVDESGKGDFFGPLCVAAVFADENCAAELHKLGVKDSKKLTDSTILNLATKIEASYPYSIVRIGPERYNSLYQQFGNLNLLLGWGHATAIDDLLTKVSCTRVIIDQFAAEHVVLNALKRKKCSVTLEQRTKAEEDVVVAAASILARAAFVRGLAYLSQKYGIELPKGASSQTIAIGKQLVNQYGPDVLKQLAKLHFKTTEEILKAP